MKIVENHKEIVESRGYEYIGTYDRKDILIDSGRIKPYKYSYIRVKCPYCNKEYDVRLSNFKNGSNCNHCCNKYENSFAYHIEVELNEDLDKYWDFEKNNKLGINPYHIYKSGKKEKVWIKCQEKHYHESYDITCSNFSNGKRCPYCSSNKIHYFDSLGFLYHDLAKMIVEDERNNLKYEDIYKISLYKNEKYYFKCLNCSKEINEKISLGNIVRRGYSCNYCSDGISIPEKFMINLLGELKIDFITQLNKNQFNWIKGKMRYDFYIPSLNIIIETHGLQHYEENTFDNIGGKSLKEEQENDRLKKELALKNGIDKYIVVDCRYSELEWLKNNTIKMLNGIFDLNNIDWNSIWEICQSSLVVKTWELWNKGLRIKEICDTLNIGKSTIARYLNNGNKLGMCKYNGKEEMIKAGKNSSRSKSVICLKNKIFNSITEGAEYYGLKSVGDVSKCCSGSAKSAGKHPITGEKLVWRYLIWKHDKIYRVKNQLLINKNNIA